MAKHRVAVMVLGGAPSDMEGASDPKAIGVVLPPAKFDMAGAKPGDSITVTCECKVSADGKHLEVMKVDGSEQDDDEDPGAPDDDDSTPGDRWDMAMKGRNQED